MIQELLKYQEIDNALKKIESELNSSEEFKKQRQAKAYLKEAEEALKKMNTRAEEINLILKSSQESHAQTVELLSEYMSIVDKTEDMQELRYLGKKVAQLQKALDNLDRDITGMISEIESVLKNFDELKTRVPAAQKQFKENKEKFEEIKKSRESEAMTYKTRLEKLAASLNPLYLSSYQKLRAESVHMPLVPLRGENQCGGCNMEIPSGVVVKLDRDNVIICDNCRRMIYKST